VNLHLSHEQDPVRGQVEAIARAFGCEQDRRVQIWDQFPLGGMLTVQILRGDPRKVAAAGEGSGSDSSLPVDRPIVSAAGPHWQELKKNVLRAPVIL
jgi:hypothetical protein